MVEVEAQALGGDVASFLKDVRTENFSERGVQQVRGGVEFRRLRAVVREAAFELLLRAGARQCLVRFERFLETVFVDAQSFFRREFLRQFEREAVRVVEVERALAVHC